MRSIVDSDAFFRLVSPLILAQSPLCGQGKLRFTVLSLYGFHILSLF